MTENEGETGQIGSKNKRTTKAQAAARRLEVARMLRLRMRPEEIALALKVSHWVIYKDLSIVNEGVKRWYYDQAKDGLLFDHRISIEVLQDRQRQLFLIEDDPNTSTRDKISAAMAIVEIESLLHSWQPITQRLLEQTVGVEGKRPLAQR